MSRNCVLIAILSVVALTPRAPAPSAEPNKETTLPATEPKSLPLT